MKLVTKQLERTFTKYPLYSQDGKGKEARVLAKYFLQSFTWYVLEFDGDDTFFGIVVNGFEGEYGYFSLRELESLRGMWGLGVERDLYFEPSELGKATDYYLKKFVEDFFS